MKVPRRVSILCLQEVDDAYPNIKHRIEQLRQDFAVDVHVVPAVPRKFFTSPRGHLNILIGLARIAIRSLLGHIRLLAKYVKGGRTEIVFLPFPALGMGPLLRILPQRWRPHSIVCDSIISIYDTIVQDRQIVKPGSLGAGMILRIERLIYNCCDLVLVDTEENSEFMACTFRLRSSLFAAIPLATDEAAYRTRPYRPDAAGPCQVLFIGSLVPLQGARVIAEAACLLASDTSIDVTIIGTGQDHPEVHAALSRMPDHRATWIDTWQPQEILRQHIDSADICLGIFGTTDKAQRVWPFKNYHYLCAGRPLITGATRCALRLTVSSNPEAFVTVPNGDPEALADAIRALAEDIERRKRMAIAGAEFYASVLSMDASSATLKRLLASSECFNRESK